MALTTTMGPRASQPIWTRANGAFRMMMRQLAARREQRANLRELRRLDDHMLRDLGMHRSELGSVTYHRGRDMTRRQRGPVFLLRLF